MLKPSELHGFFDMCLCQSIEKGRLPKWVHLQMKFEKVLAARMLNSYNKKAKKAVSRAKTLTKRGESEKNVIKIVNTHMKKIFTEHDKRRIKKDITGYYIADRVLSANDLDIDVTDKVDSVSLKGSRHIEKQDEPEIGVVFDIRDKEIVRLLVAQNLIAAQNLYKNGFSKTVVDVIRKIVGREGLSRVRQAEMIELELSKALGLKKGKMAIEDIKPKKFRGSSKDYYTGLAQTTLTRAQVFGKIQLFRQGDFKTYQFSAIMDKRTSVICRSLNGRIFTVAQGEAHVNRVLSAKSTNDIKRVAGWRRDLSEFGVENEGERKRGTGSKELSAELAKAGLSMPPLHFRCRSTIRPLT